MDGRRAHNAHPAFVETLKQLSPEEAQHLHAFLKAPGTPIVSLQARVDRFFKFRAEWEDHCSWVSSIVEPLPKLDREIEYTLMMDNYFRLQLVYPPTMTFL